MGEVAEKKCRVEKVLESVTVELDQPDWIWRYSRGPEEAAMKMEKWVKELEEFFRDHRSQDQVSFTVVRHEVEKCSACHDIWEEDDGGSTGCCINCGARREN